MGHTEESQTSSKEDMVQRFSEALTMIGKSQADLAKSLDFVPSRINGYAKGRVEPTSGVFIRLFFEEPKVNWFYVFGGDKYGKIDSISSDLLYLFKEGGLLSSEKINKLMLEVENLNRDKEFLTKEIAYLKENAELYKKLLEQATTQN